MAYTIIEPPINRPFREMTLREAKTYFRWFLAIMPERIAMLEQEIQASSEIEYQNWVADKTEDSLLVLGQWLAQNVETMPRPEEEKRIKEEELAQLPARLRPMYEVPDWVLTERTYSLITDIGMYLGETFRGNFSNIEWELFIKTKRWMDHHWPVLNGFGKREICNPLRIVNGFASGLQDGTRKGDGLYKLYEIWERYIDGSAPVDD